MKPGRFEGKVAIVTGSSRGIGKAIARLLAEHGAAVVLNGRNPERLASAEKELLAIHDRVLSVSADVSTPEGGQLLVGKALERFGRIDILINNVGVSMRGRFAGLDPGVFDSMFKSNVAGAVSPSIAALPNLRETKGSLVFITSLAGIRGLPGLSAYSSAKMSLRAIAESIRIEEKSHGIHVGLIYVGYTENEAGKETVAADGSLVKIAPRSGKGVQTMESVARAVFKTISRRKFISVLTPIGKLNAVMQRFFPRLVEWIILANLEKFEERSK